MNSTPLSPRSWQAWRHHLATSMLVAAFFFVVLLACEALHAPFLEDMDSWGRDAAMRVFASRALREGPKVVLINIDADEEEGAAAPALAELLDQVRDAGPKAVAVDVVVDRSAKAERVKPLADVLADPGWQGMTVAIPVVNDQLWQHIEKLPWVRPAAPDLRADDDGVVRRAYATECTRGPGEVGSYLRPTLSEAVLAGAPASMLGCRSTDAFSPRTVLFGRERNRADDRSAGVLLLPSRMLASHKEDLRDAYVIVGHVGPGADAFVTPVGLLSGARVHAAAVWTRASGKGDAGQTARWALLVPLELASWMLLGLASASYTTLLGREPPANRLERQPFHVVFLRFLLEGVLGMLIVLGLLSGLVLVWTRLAAGFVESGVFVGTVVPAFGAVLEAFAHAGRHVVDLAEWVAARGLARSLAGKKSILLLCLAASAALPATRPAAAEEPAACASRLTHVVVGSLEDVRIEPGGRRVGSLSKALDLDPDDEVDVLNARTTVEVEQTFWGEAKVTRLRGPDAMALLPCPPSRESWTGWWQAFWGARSLHAGLQTRVGATRSRGAPSTGAPYLAGRLRELSNLATATGVVRGGRGFAFAWAGGVPPYQVYMEDTVTGAPLADSTSEVPETWWPDWQAPAAPFTMVVRDAEGVELSHSFGLLPPRAVRDDTAGAIDLFENALPERMEALRLMRWLADTDPLARRAYEKVRIDGAGG